MRGARGGPATRSAGRPSGVGSARTCAVPGSPLPQATARPSAATAATAARSTLLYTIGSRADNLLAMIPLADADATRRAGAALARLVRGGDAIALVGDLGAGKTTFTAGLVEALGGGAASSPTFALVHEYRGGALIVWHVDLY